MIQGITDQFIKQYESLVAEVRRLRRKVDGFKVTGAPFINSQESLSLAIIPPKKQSSESPPPNVRAYKFVSHSDDSLICHAWDGTTEGEDAIYIAKPYLLRPSTAARTGYSFSYTNNYTRTSTKTTDSSTEDQVIVPDYVAGDIIYATPIRAETLNFAKISLLDINPDGRAWAKDG